MRRGAVIGAAALLTVAAVVGVLAFFNARDDSTIGDPASAPGRADPNQTAPFLRRGNVAFFYRRAADRAPLEALARDVAGPHSAALEAAGQTIVVTRRPTGEGVAATAYKRRLDVSSPDDPALREFAEYWLGRGAMR